MTPAEGNPVKVNQKSIANYFHIHSRKTRFIHMARNASLSTTSSYTARNISTASCLVFFQIYFQIFFFYSKWIRHHVYHHRIQTTSSHRTSRQLSIQSRPIQRQILWNPMPLKVWKRFCSMGLVLLFELVKSKGKLWVKKIKLNAKICQFITKYQEKYWKDHTNRKPKKFNYFLLLRRHLCNMYHNHGHRNILFLWIRRIQTKSMYTVIMKIYSVDSFVVAQVSSSHVYSDGFKRCLFVVSGLSTLNSTVRLRPPNDARVYILICQISQGSRTVPMLGYAIWLIYV